MGKAFLLMDVSSTNEYKVVIGSNPSNSCPNFWNMLIFILRNKGKYVPCKHMCYIFLQCLLCDLELDIYIHHPTLNEGEVDQMLRQEVEIEEEY